MSYVFAFLGFAALIILHEAGHFVAAKAVGMRVERFSLFFGPLLVKTRRGETEYGIGPIPLGGYVKITGMNPNEQFPEERELSELEARRAQLEDDASTLATDPARQDVPADDHRDIDARAAELTTEIKRTRERAYYNQPVWKRVVVILAGPVVNLVLAFAIVWILLLSNGQANGPDRTVQAVLAKTPAATVLKPRDTLVSVDGVRGSATALRTRIGAHRCPGAPVAGCRAARAVTLVVRRQGRLQPLHVRPVYSATDKRMELGFQFGLAVTYPGVLGAAGSTISNLASVTGKTVSTIVRVFQPAERRQLHGVVGGYETTQKSFATSPALAFEVLALISLSLGVINLFPFLPLDGGHIFWALAEKVRGQRISFAVMERAGLVGFVLIIMLFFVGLSNDISQLGTGTGLTSH